jgi:two-component system, OmpR family, KDP operon response regulator KdpE
MVLTCDPNGQDLRGLRVVLRAAGFGIDLCRRLRDWSTMALIVVSGAATENDKVLAFESRADDFLPKPFARHELAARLGAVLRRTQPLRPAPILDLGGRIDLGGQTVRRGEHAIHLTPTEFRILRVLARHRGLPAHRSFAARSSLGPGILDARDTLRAHTANLRRKLGPLDAGLPLIKTYQRAGYSLVGTGHAR